MNVRKIQIVSLIVLGSMELTIANAQSPRFYSESIKHLYHSLPKICKEDSVFHCEAIVVMGDSVRLNYRMDECGFLVHIGYDFFNYTDSLPFNRSIVQFLEREFLKWVITNKEAEILEILSGYTIDNVFVKINDKPINTSSLKKKKELISILNKTNGFYLNKVNQNYSVKIINTEGNEIEIVFPNDPKLISGMDKKERDDLIFNQLKNHKAADRKNDELDFANPTNVNDSIFILYGSYYLIPEINNNVFLQKKDSAFHVLLNKDYMNESFVNTMLGLSSLDHDYSIKHVMYGYNVENYLVRGKDFYDFFSIDYQRYFGVETCDKDNLSGTLIFQDKETEYIHLAYIKMTMEDLMSDNDIEVKLYTNIPRSSLRNLFGEIGELEELNKNYEIND